MKKRFIQRQLKSSLKVNPSKLISFKFIIKFLVTLFITILLLLSLIYFSIFTGYESKMINDISEIPEEIITALIFFDGDIDNFKEYSNLASNAYLNRNVSEILIINEYDIDLTESIKVYLDKIPQSKLKVENDIYYANVCNEYLNIDPLKKYILISNPDISIRLSAICNNFNVYLLPLRVDNVKYTIDYNKRIEEALKIVFNSF